MSSIRSSAKYKTNGSRASMFFCQKDAGPTKIVTFLSRLFLYLSPVRVVSSTSDWFIKLIECITLECFKN